jgi:hypothetical protein
MDQIASIMLTVPIENHMFFINFLYYHKLTFKNWYMYSQHHIEHQVQLPHLVGFTKSL